MSEVSFEVTGRVARITLNRPAAHENRGDCAAWPGSAAEPPDRAAAPASGSTSGVHVGDN
jgi:hypothetical protein